MRLLVACLAAVVLTGPDDALREFDRAFKRSRNPEDVQERRAAALAALPSPAGEDAGLALVDAYRVLEGELFDQEERHRGYIERGSRDKYMEMRPGLDGPRRLQHTLLDRLAEATDAEAAAAALEAVLRKTDWPLAMRLAAAERADVAGHAGLTAVVTQLKRARKEPDLLVALVAAARLGPDAAPAGGAVVAHLDHASAAVREAAADAAAALRLPGAIAPMIAQLAEERGRTKVRLASALQVLTGQNHGTAVGAWRAWFDAEGAPYAAGEVRLGTGDPKVVSGVSTDGLYHGIPLDGEAILFVVDVSKSMNGKLLGKNAGEGAETRMERARSQLVQALDQLRPHQSFDIIGFGGTLPSFAEEVVPATEENVADAQAWVRDVDLTLGTRMFDALDLAFARAGRPVEDAFFDSSVDTVFLLTDGYPIVAGKNDDRAHIRESLARWNLRRRVVVNVIALGKPVPAQFLKNLAADHGGVFVHEGAGG